MSTFKIALAYDGTDFVGWQRQASGTSIQGLLEDALRDLDQRDVAVAGAGRTDAGVHALGQVAAFSLVRGLSADAVVRALNAHLPDAIRVMSAEEVPPDFHPRFGARRKSYRYRIWNGEVVSPFERRYVWHVSDALNVEAMAAAAQALVGMHDFTTFQASGASTSTTERAVYTSRVVADAPSGQQGRLVLYEVTGGGFLRHMVRIIVGSLVEVGRGRRPLAWMREVLDARDRALAGPTAPPGGLFLVGVEYEKVEVDPTRSGQP